MYFLQKKDMIAELKLRGLGSQLNGKETKKKLEEMMRTAMKGRFPDQ